MKRIDSIDFTRGLVMVIMALDHVRDLMHTTALTQDPTNLDTTTTGLFLTRWITHLCAPTFVFLSGTSAFISLRNSNDPSAGRKFMVKRGLWLILLEFTVITLGLWADIKFRMMVFQVIGAIGLGLICLSLMTRLSSKTIGAMGLIIILGHNLVQGISFNDNIPLRVLWSFLFRLDIFPVTPDFTFAVLYPFIPWFGIMLVGYASGNLFLQEENKRRKTLFVTSLTILSFFILLRFGNFYGDPIPWKIQKNPLFTLLSFINIFKYPPSLLYTFLTLGIMFFILAAVDGVRNKFTAIISVYGKVPLFYYILHWYLVHSLMFLLMFYQGFAWKDLPFGAFQFGRPPAGSGVELPYIYIIWAFVVISLYPLCKWYNAYKAAHKEKKWLRYI